MQVTLQHSDTTTKTWVLVLASIGSFMVALDALVVATALDRIRRDLGASIETLQWTMSAYNLSTAVLLLTGAALGDRFGRRRLFITGLAVFVGASAGCALAGSAGWLIAARVAQGAGAALVVPLSMALLSAVFPPNELARALGIFAALMGLALIAGPAIGGAIAEGINWRWIFWVNAPIGLLAIPFVRRRVPESFGPDSALDIPGVTLVTGAALGVVWGLIRGNPAGWTSVEVVLALAVGLVLAVAFVAWELHVRQPMVPMRFFCSRAFTSGIAALFLFFAALFGVLFFLPQFLQSARGYGPLGAGMRLLPFTAMVFFAPVAGGLVNRVGERVFIVGGLALQATGLAWLGLVAGPDQAYAHLVAPLIVAGAGGAMALPAAQNAVLSSVARADAGKASGTLNMFRFLGGMSGIAVVVAVFARTGSFRSPSALSAGFVAAMLVCAALAFVGALAGLWQPRWRQAALEQSSVKA